MDDEEVYCPRCMGDSFVKNGKVRGVQRYRCQPCRFNFVMEVKHRWDRSAKLINVLCLADGENLTASAESIGVTPQTLDRWLLEAKEHSNWFIDALADMAVYSFDQDSDIEKALSGAIGFYQFITKRDANQYYDAFVPKLLERMIHTGSDSMLARLEAFLIAHHVGPPLDPIFNYPSP